jgi:hypothetical protein
VTKNYNKTRIVSKYIKKKDTCSEILIAFGITKCTKSVYNIFLNLLKIKITTKSRLIQMNQRYLDRVSALLLFETFQSTGGQTIGKVLTNYMLQSQMLSHTKL